MEIFDFDSKIKGCEQRMEGDTSALMPAATSETRKQQTVTIMSAIVAIPNSIFIHQFAIDKFSWQVVIKMEKETSRPSVNLADALNNQVPSSSS